MDLTQLIIDPFVINGRRRDPISRQHWSHRGHCKNTCDFAEENGESDVRNGFASKVSLTGQCIDKAGERCVAAKCL
jgi:hypothetical protein